MSTIHFPETTDGLAVPDGAVVRAGGTDLQERLRADNAHPDIVDLTRLSGFTRIETAGDGTTIGAGAKIATIARELDDRYPALAITAGSLATPQIRAVGTIGGNLVQRTRCWYYRHPDIDCHKSGGDSCPARTGRHLYGVVFDRSECVHPHPSSIAMALLTYDATVRLSSGTELTVADLLGDGVDPTRDNRLPAGEVVTEIALPAPWTDERAAYFRSISRFEAEWPLVEVVVRARLADDGTVAECGLGLGGVATVPIRLPQSEALLVGRRVTDEVVAEVAAAAADGANPLPETGYKVELVQATVAEALERLRRLPNQGEPR